MYFMHLIQYVSKNARQESKLPQAKHVATDCYSCYRFNGRLKWNVKDRACHTLKMLQWTRKICMEKVSD